MHWSLLLLSIPTCCCLLLEGPHPQPAMWLTLDLICSNWKEKKKQPGSSFSLVNQAVGPVLYFPLSTFSLSVPLTPLSACEVTRPAPTLRPNSWELFLSYKKKKRNKKNTPLAVTLQTPMAFSSALIALHYLTPKSRTLSCPLSQPPFKSSPQKHTGFKVRLTSRCRVKTTAY